MPLGSSQFDYPAVNPVVISLTGVTPVGDYTGDPIRALFVEGAGSVKWTAPNGLICQYNLPAGWHPLPATKIFAAGTTATGLLGVKG